MGRPAQRHAAANQVGKDEDVLESIMPPGFLHCKPYGGLTIAAVWLVDPLPTKARQD
jgi:hypothetical protein